MATRVLHATEIAGLTTRIADGRQAMDWLAARGDVLTADERAALERAAERGRQAMNRLLEGHMRLVVGIAHSRGAGGRVRHAAGLTGLTNRPDQSPGHRRRGRVGHNGGHGF